MYQRFGFKILANGNASYTIHHKALTITWLTKQDIHTTYLFFCESSIHNQKMIENRRCPKLPTELADKDIGNSVEVIGFGDRSRTLLKIFETDCDFIVHRKWYSKYIYSKTPKNWLESWINDPQAATPTQKSSTWKTAVQNATQLDSAHANWIQSTRRVYVEKDGNLSHPSHSTAHT